MSGKPKNPYPKTKRSNITSCFTPTARHIAIPKTNGSKPEKYINLKSVLEDRHGVENVLVPILTANFNDINTLLINWCYSN